MAKAKKVVLDVLEKPVKLEQIAHNFISGEKAPVARSQELARFSVESPAAVGLRRFEGRLVLSITTNGRVEGWDIPTSDPVEVSIVRRTVMTDKMMRTVPETKGA